MSTPAKPRGRSTPRKKPLQVLWLHIASAVTTALIIGVFSSMITGAKMTAAFAVDQTERRDRIDAELREHEDRLTIIERQYVPRAEHDQKDRTLTEELTTLNQRTTETRDDVKELRAVLNQIVISSNIRVK